MNGEDQERKKEREIDGRKRCAQVRGDSTKHRDPRSVGRRGGGG